MPTVKRAYGVLRFAKTTFSICIYEVTNLSFINKLNKHVYIKKKKSPRRSLYYLASVNAYIILTVLCDFTHFNWKLTPLLFVQNLPATVIVFSLYYVKLTVRYIEPHKLFCQMFSLLTTLKIFYFFKSKRIFSLSS